MERLISLPEDLLAKIEGTAIQQGKSVDQWVEEAIRAQLEDPAWRDLLQYGLQTGRASAYSEADVPAIVKARRRTNPSQH